MSISLSVRRIRPRPWRASEAKDVSKTEKGFVSSLKRFHRGDPGKMSFLMAKAGFVRGSRTGRENEEKDRNDQSVTKV